MPVNAVLAGVAVGDFDSALSWYERLLGRPADARPMDGLAEWHFTDSAVIQVIQDPDRAGRSLLTLSADDLQEQVAGLKQRGLAPSPVDAITSDKVLIATIADPEGNAITLVQQRSS